MPYSVNPLALDRLPELSLTTDFIPTGAEPEAYRFINKAGAYSAGAAATGVSMEVTRDNFAGYVVSGIYPVNVADGQTIVEGDYLEADANGRAIKATDPSDASLVKGIALDAVTTTDDTAYIRLQLSI